MRMTRRAVIDVGTNSVKLLVGDVAAGAVVPVREEGRQTRLGEGFYETHRLSAAAIQRTAVAVGAFAAVARSDGAASLRVVATSAARDAVNARELTAALEAATGVPVEVISGDREAGWAFRGATSSPALAARPILLLDLGGGSTEFIAGCGPHHRFQHSFDLGTVRFYEGHPPADPPAAGELAACRAALRQFLAGSVAPDLAPALEGLAAEHPGTPVLLVGAGGTASVLACMEGSLAAFDRERIEATALPARRVREQADRLWGMKLQDRRQIPGLPPDRADIMLAGVLIYEAILETFGFAELRITTRGLRFGVLLDQG